MPKSFITGCTLVAAAFLASMYAFMVQGANDHELKKASSSPLTSKSHDITIIVAPRNLSADAMSWDFEITLESHTRVLSDDLAKSSALIGDDGRHATPLGWEGSPPGGHHRSGWLRYKPLSPAPHSLELRIWQTGEPVPRNFRWQLE